MVTTDEELQVAEFLKRAEIRTMKKDLQALRENDALKERDRIVKLKTLEEQLEEKRKIQESEISKASLERAKREDVLTANVAQERLAEKDLKNYATEEERQQIFLLEAHRLNLGKNVDEIDQKKEPASKLEKNQPCFGRFFRRVTSWTCSIFNEKSWKRFSYSGRWRNSRTSRWNRSRCNCNETGC